MNIRARNPAALDLNETKRRQQTAWNAGDYALIGTTLQIIGELLREAVDLRSTARVLLGQPIDKKILGQ